MGDDESVILGGVAGTEKAELMARALWRGELPGAVGGRGGLEVAANGNPHPGNRRAGAGRENAPRRGRDRHGLDHRERKKTAAADQEERGEQN